MPSIPFTSVRVPLTARARSPRGAIGIGTDVTASGPNAIAIGTQAIANDPSNVALGCRPWASKALRSVMRPTRPASTAIGHPAGHRGWRGQRSPWAHTGAWSTPNFDQQRRAVGSAKISRWRPERRGPRHVRCGKQWTGHRPGRFHGSHGGRSDGGRPFVASRIRPFDRHRLAGVLDRPQRGLPGSHAPLEQVHRPNRPSPSART